ncbi:MAG: glycerol-3-phosphate acyltransferase [Dehalococcoidia bacterium]|nr:glycerol-3-phosphate acyltransferase [Dehalococcoidia bacterium]
MLQIALAALAAYLLGSIPTAYLVGRMYGVDIRKLGDTNVGAGNTLRQVGKLAAAIVAFADIGKGVAAVLLARALAGGDVGAMLAGVLAVVGHNWPVFLGFRGGRGAATGMGVFFAFSWYQALTVILFPLAILIFLLFRRGTYAALAVFAPQPVLYLLRYLAGPLPIPEQIVPALSLPVVLYSGILPLFILMVHVGRSLELRRERRRRKPGAGRSGP